MSITELFSLGALATGLAGFIISAMVNMSKRIRDLEKGLSAETARSQTEDKNHSTVIQEIKKDISDINNKLDDLISVVGKSQNVRN